MKKLILIAAILLAWAPAWAWNPYVMGYQKAAATASYRSCTEATGSATTEASINEPSGVVSGDLLLVFITSDTYGVTFSSSGWTQFADVNHGSSFEMYGFYKTASGSESSWTFTASGSATWEMQCIAVSKDGGTWVTPSTSGYSNVSSAENTTITTGSVTGVSGCLLLCVFGSDGNNIVSTPPATMTQIEETATSSSRMYSYREAPGSGAVTRTVIWDVSDQNGSIAIVCAAE